MIGKSLEEWGDFYGVSHKGVGGHGYLEIYERYLGDLRGTACKLLEIGIAQGGSQKMWRDYLGEASQVVGLDILPVASMDLGPRITLVQGDQGDPATLASVAAMGPYDVITDDGSHQGHDQITAFLSLWRAVKPGGLYVIEDMHTSYHGWHGSPPESLLEFVTLLVNRMNEYGIHPLAEDATRLSRDALGKTIMAIHYWRYAVFILKRK